MMIYHCTILLYNIYDNIIYYDNYSSTVPLFQAVTSPYNADFDGDEMNLHLAQDGRWCRSRNG